MEACFYSRDREYSAKARKRGEEMLIRVMHNAGYYDYVKPQLLDRLIKNEEIISFYRESGVVVLGADHVRSSQKTHYDGSERRFAA